ncbi:hypothetical protein OL548_34705 (plasmid) [Lysinibacillus sp. MHQ-1]|nr:hypothetical protein OL548_34705 [Lysinibacillus sp. MHQ-1]
MGNSIRGQAMDEFWNDAWMWIVALFFIIFSTMIGPIGYSK